MKLNKYLYQGLTVVAAAYFFLAKQAYCLDDDFCWKTTILRQQNEIEFI